MARKTSKETTPKVEKVKSDFAVELIVNGETFKSEGASLADALSSIVSNPAFPQAIKSKVVINYGKGEVLGQRVLPTVVARRIFNMIGIKPEALELIAKKMEVSF